MASDKNNLNNLKCKAVCSHGYKGVKNMMRAKLIGCRSTTDYPGIMKEQNIPSHFSCKKQFIKQLHRALYEKEHSCTSQERSPACRIVGKNY